MKTNKDYYLVIEQRLLLILKEPTCPGFTSYIYTQFYKNIAILIQNFLNKFKKVFFLH